MFCKFWLAINANTSGNSIKLTMNHSYSSNAICSITNWKKLIYITVFIATMHIICYKSIGKLKILVLPNYEL